MIRLPLYITIPDFTEYLDELYPPHDIYVWPENGEEGNNDYLEDETDRLRYSLLVTAYRELYLLYNLDSAPTNLVISAVHHHAVHIWRTEGSRSARLDLISQGVVEAGVYKEKYGDLIPVSPFIRDLLEAYTRTVAIQTLQLSRDMEFLD